MSDPKTRRAERLRRLLALAADQSTTEAERQLAAARAADIMTRDGIEAAQATAHAGQPSAEAPQVWTYAVPGAGGHGPARARAAGLIADALGGKIAFQESAAPGPCMVIVVAAPADITTMKTLLPLVMHQAELAAATAAASGRREPRYLASFFVGYGSQVADRIAQRRTAYAAEGTGADLVLAARADAVDALFAERFGRHLVRGHGPRLTGDGLRAGRAAARRADLGDTRISQPSAPSLPA